MHRCISIWYNDQTADNGEPIDLFSYLENELNNAGINAELFEQPPNAKNAATNGGCSWRNPPEPQE